MCWCTNNRGIVKRYKQVLLLFTFGQARSIAFKKGVGNSYEKLKSRIKNNVRRKNT